MLNPFQINSSSVYEHRIAVNFWTLSMIEVKQDYPDTDHELIEVYFDWLDEYCNWDLRNNY